MTEKERLQAILRNQAEAAKLLRHAAELDRLADDDSISDAEFDRLMAEAAAVTQQAGKLQQETEHLTGPELTRCSDWMDGFLRSFNAGTQRITLKQAAVFQRLRLEDHGHSLFWYAGRRFYAESPNYRNGFSSLIISK